MTSRDVLTSCRDITWRRPIWRHMTWQNESAQGNPSETPKITFFNLATLILPLGISQHSERSCLEKHDALVRCVWITRMDSLEKECGMVLLKLQPNFIIFLKPYWPLITRYMLLVPWQCYTDIKFRAVFMAKGSCILNGQKAMLTGLLPMETERILLLKKEVKANPWIMLFYYTVLDYIVLIYFMKQRDVYTCYPLAAINSFLNQIFIN